MANNNTDNEGGLSKVTLGIIVAVVVVIAAAVIFLTGGKSKFEPIGAGSEVIDFTLNDLSGKPVSLKDYRGKVVFLNFWATWCKPCEEEMPSMQALHQALKGQPFDIVAVSVDTGDSQPVRDYIQKYGITFTVLHDGKGKVKEAYKTTGVPETFIVDQNGIIAEKVWGPRDWSDPSSTRMIADLLKNGPKAKEEYKVKKQH